MLPALGAWPTMTLTVPVVLAPPSSVRTTLKVSAPEKWLGGV